MEVLYLGYLGGNNAGGKGGKRARTLWIHCTTPSLELSHRPHPTIYPPPILRVCGLCNQHPFWKSQIKVCGIGKIRTEWKLWRQGNMPVALSQIQCHEKMSSTKPVQEFIDPWHGISDMLWHLNHLAVVNTEPNRPTFLYHHGTMEVYHSLCDGEEPHWAARFSRTFVWYLAWSWGFQVAVGVLLSAPAPWQPALPPHRLHGSWVWYLVLCSWAPL